MRIVIPRSGKKLLTLEKDHLEGTLEGIMTEQEFRDLSTFFSDLEIHEEPLDQAGVQVRVTYTYRGKAYTIQPLHYQPETVTVPGDSEIEKDHVLDINRHAWPESHNNTMEIIEEMVSLLQTASEEDKSQFRDLLKDIEKNIKNALKNGMPPRFWPTTLNNNHWHDVVRFIQACLQSPEQVKQCRVNDPIIARLIFKWNNQGRRFAFTGNYMMVRNLVEVAMKHRPLLALEEQVKRLSRLLEWHRQMILTGPPGTSKTYLARRVTAHLLGIPLEEVDKEENAEASAFEAARFHWTLAIRRPTDSLGSTDPEPREAMASTLPRR
jgi:hypothetical protein